MIIAGIILLILGYVLPMPLPLNELAIDFGWLLVLLGIVFWVLGGIGHPVGGRRYWF